MISKTHWWGQSQDVGLDGLGYCLVLGPLFGALPMHGTSCIQNDCTHAQPILQGLQTRDCVATFLTLFFLHPLWPHL